MEELYSPVRFTNILYATDFSPASQSALRYAVSIAGKYGSHIFVMHIIPRVADSGTSASAPHEMGAEGHTEAIEAMVELEAQLQGVPHEFIIRKGDIWKQTAQIIEEKAISLLVMGTHGRSGASKVIMGSVAEEIFRKASCPVLTVGPNVCGEPDAVADIRAILCPIDFKPDSLAAIAHATLPNKTRPGCICFM